MGGTTKKCQNRNIRKINYWTVTLNMDIKDPTHKKNTSPRPVSLNRRAAARYRALASIIPGREKPEETTI
jgi:hypothetical protein